MGEALFELLAIRRELAKEELAKEGGPEVRGAVKAYKELMELFQGPMPKKRVFS